MVYTILHAYFQVPCRLWYTYYGTSGTDTWYVNLAIMMSLIIEKKTIYDPARRSIYPAVGV